MEESVVGGFQPCKIEVEWEERARAVGWVGGWAGGMSEESRREGLDIEGDERVVLRKAAQNLLPFLPANEVG